MMNFTGTLMDFTEMLYQRRDWRAYCYWSAVQSLRAGQSARRPAGHLLLTSA